MSWKVRIIARKFNTFTLRKKCLFSRIIIFESVSLIHLFIYLFIYLFFTERHGYLAFIRWVVLYPIRILLYYTIPDCRKIR